MKKNTQKNNASKMIALTNQVKQLQKQADSGRLAPSKVKRKNKGARPPTRTMAASSFTDGACRVGLKDLVAHKVSWVCGDVFVGNGVTGITDALYFRTVSGSGKLAQGASGQQVAILGSDEEVGATYVTDIEKHYARKVIRSLSLRLISLVPSTANSCMVVVAPVRGVGSAPDTVLQVGVLAAASLQNTLGMSGAKSLASYETASIDLMPYLANGFGAKQNEYNINADGEAPNTWGTGACDLTGLSPAAFVVSGLNTTAALRGLSTHYIVVEQVVDYLDFIAGNVNQNPSAFAVSRDDALFILKLIMTSGQKNPTDLALTKALVKYAGKDSF